MDDPIYIQRCVFSFFQKKNDKKMYQVPEIRCYLQFQLKFNQ
jgi:hypothetical protein